MARGTGQRKLHFFIWFILLGAQGIMPYLILNGTQDSCMRSMFSSPVLHSFWFPGVYSLSVIVLLPRHVPSCRSFSLFHTMAPVYMAMVKWRSHCWRSFLGIHLAFPQVCCDFDLEEISVQFFFSFQKCCIEFTA